MNISLKKNILMISMIVAVASSISACKPSYEAPAADPVMTTMAADAPYDMDFIQLNNDLIDALSRKQDVFPFIKAIDLDGSNDDKTIRVDIDVQNGVSDEAIEVLLSEITKQIADAAYTQDFRLVKADDEQFGSVFDIYSYTYKVTCDDQVRFDETVAAGGQIPLDPGMDGDAVKEAIEELQESTSPEETTSANN